MSGRALLERGHLTYANDERVISGDVRGAKRMMGDTSLPRKALGWLAGMFVQNIPLVSKGLEWNDEDPSFCITPDQKAKTFRIAREVVLVGAEEEKLLRRRKGFWLVRLSRIKDDEGMEFGIEVFKNKFPEVGICD